MSRVIVVEYAFESAQSRELRDQDARRLSMCLAVREARRLQSLLSVDGRRALATFEAPDAETVRNAHRSAGVAFEAAWPAESADDQPG
jgi:hypothetical protein